MLSRIFSYIYQQPLDKIIQFSIIVVIEWAILMYLTKNDFKRTKRMNQCCTAVALLAILGATILDRTPGRYYLGAYLEPFSSFGTERFSAGLCRECILNVFLFLPLGIFMPFSLPERTKNKVRITILFGMMLSVGIETMQYLFGMGLCETDDVIHNTLGAALGSRAYVLFEKLPEMLDALQHAKERLSPLSKSMLTDKTSETPDRL